MLGAARVSAHELTAERSSWIPGTEQARLDLQTLTAQFWELEAAAGAC